MKEMFLLGAGASVEAKISTSFKMTEDMLDVFSKDFRLRTQYRILKFVVGGLLFQQGSKGLNPYQGTNIEELFNAIKLLSERDNSEIAPFIGSWHPLLQDFQIGSMSSSTASSLIKNIYEPMPEYIKAVLANKPFLRVNDFQIRNQFTENFTEAVRQSLGSKSKWLFNQTTEAMIEKLIDMVWISDPSLITYLRPLLDYSELNNASITTLNYDNSIELAAQIYLKKVDTGFTAWSRSGAFTFKRNWIPLIKLHGSIDWALSNEHSSKEKILSFQTIKKVNPDSKTDMNYRPAIIFGGKNKLTANGPSLSLLRAFENQLSKSTKLTIIGYSFHDDHVNEFIRNWINGSTNRKITIVDPNFDENDSEFCDQLRRVSDPNRLEIKKTIASEAYKNL